MPDFSCPQNRTIRTYKTCDIEPIRVIILEIVEALPGVGLVAFIHHIRGVLMIMHAFLFAIIVFCAPALAWAQTCPSILAYGGNNGGSVDNTSALTATIAANPSGRVCVEFPPGTYAFSAAQSYTFPNSTAAVTFKGEGSGVSNLLWSGTSGLVINYLGPNNSAHIQNLSILTGASNLGNGIRLNQTAATVANPANSQQSDITNVAIQGNLGSSSYWANAVSVNGVSNVNFTNDTILGAGNNGVGVLLQGTSSATAVQFNFTGDDISFLNTGIYISPYVQGLSISQSNFNGGPYGIFVPSGANGLDQLSITGSQFNFFTSAIYLNGAVPNMLLSNNLISVSRDNAIGIYINGGGYFNMTGNSFSLNGSPTNVNMIIVSNSIIGQPGIISGNQFIKGTTAVYLTSSSSGVSVQSNVYYGNSNKVINSGTGNTVGGGSE